MRKGIAVSPGVVTGVAWCINPFFVNPDTKRLADHEVTAELARYEAARDRAANDLRAMQQKIELQVSHEAAAIFGVHETILRDTAFTGKLRGWIVEDRLTAETALHRLLEEYTALMSDTQDEYIRERLADVRDVVIRINNHLSSDERLADPKPTGPVILVAEELLPSQAMALDEMDVLGIVTQAGSQTSHAAIIARSRGIPAVSGVPDLLKHVKTGDTVAVDGREGHVTINPDDEILKTFRKLQQDFFDLRNRLVENRDHPAVAAGGLHLELLANINGESDAQAAQAMGACGVGLYRTEYLYLTHPDVPDEEEQLNVYRKVIAASPNRRVTIRTLDIGGDKTVSYLGQPVREANPFMGWRSIRLSFELPEFFLAQVRAVLRAAADISPGDGEVRLMFPMITTLEEMRRVRGMVRRAVRQLKEEKKEFREVPIGMMLEVPAASVVIESLLDEVDFVSIGSNDLIQYLMAADRDNPKVSHLCQPLAPAVLHVLSHVIRACNEAGVPVTLCGEMASLPRAFLLLLGMGLRSFSMSPAFIPSIKDLAANISQSAAAAMLRRALRLKTTAHIRRFMGEQVSRIAPNLKILDSE